jgi:signal transduction histidine kinase
MEEDGLPKAIRLLAEGVSKMGIECNLEVSNDLKINNQTDALQAYRIVQEAVNNAVKHSNATRVDICLGASESHCELSIKDNGIGFNTDEKLYDGLGTRIMRYRAGIVGSNLYIESSPGKGTVVRCKKQY